MREVEKIPLTYSHISLAQMAEYERGIKALVIPPEEAAQLEQRAAADAQSTAAQ